MNWAIRQLGTIERDQLDGRRHQRGEPAPLLRTGEQGQWCDDETVYHPLTTITIWRPVDQIPRNTDLIGGCWTRRHLLHRHAAGQSSGK